MLSDDILKCGIGQSLSVGGLGTVHKLRERQTKAEEHSGTKVW